MWERFQNGSKMLSGRSSRLQGGRRTPVRTALPTSTRQPPRRLQGKHGELLPFPLQRTFLSAPKGRAQRGPCCSNFGKLERLK